MKTRIFYIATIVSTIVVACNNKVEQATENDGPSVMLMRFRADHTSSEEKWNEVYRSIAEYPGCCDEVWFSTGLGYPSLDSHRKNADIIRKGTEQLNNIGIRSSLQIQMTIGHGDGFNQAYDSVFQSMDWCGWTGSNGVVDTCCSCPRQVKFMEYIRQMAGIYAQNKPLYVWLDDDLRYDNHNPATINSHIGCWCDTCILAFNRENGSNWTRGSLAKAVTSDQELMAKWKSFSINSLTGLAAVITSEIHGISPDTKMGLQSTSEQKHVELSTALLKTMNSISGNPVGLRPGGGAYYDTDPRKLVIKSMNSADFRAKMGNPDYIDTWCPEIEAYPRTLESRTAQSVILEGFTALAYGENAISYFITSGVLEDQQLYVDHYYKPLSEAASMLKSYAKENEGTMVAGYYMDEGDYNNYSTAVCGIPVLIGPGKSLGTITRSDIFKYTPKSISSEIENHRRSFYGNIELHTFASSSGEIQKLRDTLNVMMPAPAICCSPFYGQIIQRVDNNTGKLKTIGVINTRIDYQYNIRIRLNDVDADSHGIDVTWNELRKSPVKLPVEKEEDKIYVVIPSIFPWSVGYLSIH